MLAVCLSVAGALKYHQDPRMHNLGNVGFGGRVHALFAPLATAMITERVYGGFEPREWLHAQLPEGQCVDLGCGVGLSTREGDVGVDTSHEMLERARLIGPDKSFLWGDAENFTGGPFAAATLSFVTHEMPRSARLNAMHNALKLAPSVWVMDIDPTYKPRRVMLTGEPYLLDYLRFMESDVQTIAMVNGATVTEAHPLQKHVRAWNLSL